MATVTKSPLSDKKFRVVLDDGGHVDFGQSGAEDYTTHKDPHRMSFFLMRHGGISSSQYEKLKDVPPSKVHTELLKVSTSKKRENWKNHHTAGFWSRWLLWSHPTLEKAKFEIQKRFNIKVRFSKGQRSRVSKSKVRKSR